MAVVVDNLDDQLLIERLLAARRCHFFDQCESLGTSVDRFTAIIICQRGSQLPAIPGLPSEYLRSQIIVVSDQTNEDFIVNTLNSGATHYFDFSDSDRLLTARINAALRYHSQRENQVLDVDPYIFKFDTGDAYHGKQELDLTAREFALAYYLFSNKSRMVSDSELMRGVWTLPPTKSTRRIHTLICILKKKMHLNTEQSKWKLVRLRAKGYQVRLQN